MIRVLRKRSEFFFVTLGVLFSILFASYLSLGALTYSSLNSLMVEPLLYRADALATFAGIKNIATNNFFDLYRLNDLGYPFESYQYDFPGYAEYGHIIVFKLISLFISNPVAIFNLYFLLGFVFCFFITFKVSRQLDLDPYTSLVISLVYTFSPFHFERIMHLTYTYYFLAPFILLISLKIYKNYLLDKSFKLSALENGLIIFFGMFGLYYVVFNLVILTFLVLIILIKSNFQWVKVKVATSVIVMMLIGLFLSMTPTIVKQINNPNNYPSLVQRQPYESEVAGFKLMQLVLPRLDHRMHKLANFTQGYSDRSPLINENISSSLGLIGSIGLLASFFYICLAIIKNKREEDLNGLYFLSLLSLVLFMFGTIGGFGSLVAHLITPVIRSWNRISIYLEFTTLLIFFKSLQLLLHKVKTHDLQKNLVLTGVLFIGIYDQTNFLDGFISRINQCSPTCHDQDLRKFHSDKKFFGEIESLLPKGSAIYVMPYMSYPEVPNKFDLETYDLMRGYINSRNLSFNYGGLRSRPGDDFYQALSKESTSKQLEVIKKLGFQGFYIDSRGFADSGKFLIEDIKQKLNMSPILVSNDNTLFFYKITQPAERVRGLIDINAAEKISNFYISNQHIDFDHCNLDFKKILTKDCDIRYLHGLSDIESWGAWSNGNAVEIKLSKSLPRRIIVAFKAQPTKPNVDKDLKMIIGKRIYTFKLSDGMNAYYKVIDLDEDVTDHIAFIPYKPEAPKNYEVNSTDERLLAVGFQSISISRIIE